MAWTTGGVGADVNVRFRCNAAQERLVQRSKLTNVGLPALPPGRKVTGVPEVLRESDKATGLNSRARSPVVRRASHANFNWRETSYMRNIFLMSGGELRSYEAGITCANLSARGISGNVSGSGGIGAFRWWRQWPMPLEPTRRCVLTGRRGMVRTIISDWDRDRAMTRLELLKQLSFGSQVAEDEVQELANYFVETHQWEQIANGKIDIIRGEKGTGKSAIYSLLTTKTDEFFDRNILLVAAENPRGTTVFRDLVSDPPASEQEFVWLWKVYILTIIAQKFKEYDFKDADARHLYGMLEDAGLLPRDYDLSGLLRASRHFVRRLMGIGIEPAVEIDQVSGNPTYKGKISLGEPDTNLKQVGFNSIETLFRYANGALRDHGYSIWVLLDRLDVAFSETHELEANALRALLRVYGDLRAFDRISLKIFLREDIWKRIFQTGFREASHINDYATLDWKPETLLNLIIRRLVSNQVLLDEFSVDRSAVLKDSKLQEKLFARLFPAQVELGRQKSPTFKWMVTRCADATNRTAPRELIHL